MSSGFGESDFVDRDYQAHQKAPGGMGSSSGTGAQRPPTCEELEGRVTETQQKLAELRQAQEALERERAALEEARRRQAEFQTGRQEMVQSLTRGVGLLTEAEFAARQEAEQMSKTLTGLRCALEKVQAIHEDTWTQDSYQVELTRALTTIENARMEWNAARLKWPILSGTASQEEVRGDFGKHGSVEALLSGEGLRKLWRLGLALTWPVAVAVLLGAIGLLAVLLWR
jgi:hypothetical protein